MRLINDGVRPTEVAQKNYKMIKNGISQNPNFRYTIKTAKREYHFDDKVTITFRDNALFIKHDETAILPTVIDFDLEELIFVEGIDYEILKKMLVD